MESDDQELARCMGAHVVTPIKLVTWVESRHSKVAYSGNSIPLIQNPQMLTVEVIQEQPGSRK